MSEKEVIRERKRERQHQREQQTLQQAFNQNGQMSKNFIAELLDKDDLQTDGLQEVTVSKIQNLLSRDWVLGNLTDAQEHDIRFKLEVMKYKILGMHPPEESVITGKTRAFLFDDEMEELLPLTQQERFLIDELIETLKARATRGRQGFERKQMNTNIAETRTQKDNQEEKSGGLRGLFS